MGVTWVLPWFHKSVIPTHTHARARARPRARTAAELGKLARLSLSLLPFRVSVLWALKDRSSSTRSLLVCRLLNFITKQGASSAQTLGVIGETVVAEKNVHNDRFSVASPHKDKSWCVQGPSF